ncbi:hypothetical protein VF14_35430 [Nostoc linckia z18]|nr:hypothetical protein VF14_35430 [Nostoc linckia z18]
MPRQSKLPIEAYIAETSGDRRAVYDRKMRREGNVRVGVWVPEGLAAEVRSLCLGLVHSDDPLRFVNSVRDLAASVRSQNALKAAASENVQS